MNYPSACEDTIVIIRALQEEKGIGKLPTKKNININQMLNLEKGRSKSGKADL